MELSLVSLQQLFHRKDAKVTKMKMLLFHMKPFSSMVLTNPVLCVLGAFAVRFPFN